MYIKQDKQFLISYVKLYNKIVLTKAKHGSHKNPDMNPMGKLLRVSGREIYAYVYQKN